MTGNRNQFVWVRGVSSPTTAASTSRSAAAAKPGAPASAAPADFSQQHRPPPPPLTSHQQRLSRGVLGASPWSNEKPSAFQRVDVAAPPRKKLALGVQGTNSAGKSPGLHMRVDSDDGISDDERAGSAMAPGPGCNKKRNQTTQPLPKQPKKKKQKREELPQPLPKQTPQPLPKQPKKKKQKREELPKHTLSSDKLTEFVQTWRDPCLQNPDDSDTILGSMLDSYAQTLTPKQFRRVKNCFTQYPGIALLNVAVRMMGTPCPSLEPTVPVSMDDKPGSSNEGSNKPRDGVAIDDVIKSTTACFESNIGVSEGSLQLKNAFSLKKLHECEIWVARQFSAHQFSALGHGTFLEFLDRHGHHFPSNWSRCLNGEVSGSSSLEVCVMQQQIGVLLCQAESNWLENGEFSVDSFRMLLKRQFPTINVDVMQNIVGGLIGTTEAHRNLIHTNTIKFSIPLLEKRWSGILLGNVGVLRNDIAQQSYPPSVSSQEAIKCLLKAPLLSDLLLWSNWDMLFAPSLGSFTHWLLSTGPIQELSCIVTTDGRFVRIDTSATVDQFLESVIQQSPFQVAVKLLSLLHIHNGSSNAPISLLKCYAQRAVDAIMNRNIDLISTGSKGKIFVHEGLHTQIAEQRACTSHYIGRIQGSFETHCGRMLTSKSLSNIDHCSVDWEIYTRLSWPSTF